MAGLLRSEPESRGPDKPATKALFVNGVRYTNSAAKVWPALIDEVRDGFSRCDCVELAASTGGPLSREQLSPQLELEKDIAKLLHADLAEVLKQTMAQLEIMGPPAAVMIRLLAGDAQLLLRELPPDSVDAEIFPYLLTWVLEWSGVSDILWNEAEVSGGFSGVDRDRRRVYGVRFHLANQHLSEGLYRRRLRFAPAVEALI